MAGKPGFVRHDVPFIRSEKLQLKASFSAAAYATVKVALINNETRSFEKVSALPYILNCHNFVNFGTSYGENRKIDATMSSISVAGRALSP